MCGAPRYFRARARCRLALLLGWVSLASPGIGCAQTANSTATSPPPASDASTNAREIAELKDEVRELRELVLRLQATLAAQGPAAAADRRGTSEAGAPAPAAASAKPDAAASAPTSQASGGAAAVATASAPGGASGAAASDFLHGVTVNALLDAYYEYNLDEPIGRVNYLRAYDVSANNFSLNQADFLVESAPDVGTGKRFGMRVDLQFGQATETLQGSSSNEQRPEIYRNIFQAYGTYWVPIHGTILTLDFGKWASSLGIEGNYTKDQMNYSRSYWFNFLPFYHAGLRADLKIDDRLSLNYWVVNGTDQTEAFNNYKDQMLGFVLTPVSSLAWTFNYYLGMEHPDIVYVTNPGPGQKNLPTQQGQPFAPIPNAPNGRLRIADTYLSWQPISALTLALEGDYVTEQLYAYSPVERAMGGALYVRYQLTPRLALAERGEYLADADGLYSGLRQYLTESTLTAQFKVDDSFLVYGEWRRDASSRPYFLTETFDVLASHQSTLGLGFVWWIGQKQGVW